MGAVDSRFGCANDHCSSPVLCMQEPIPPSSNPFANTAWISAMASPAAPADEASESAPTANASTGVSRQASNAQDSASSRSRVPTTTSSLQIESSRLPSMTFRLFALDLESTHSFAGARMLEVAVVDVASGAAWHSLVGPGTWDDYDRQMLGAGKYPCTCRKQSMCAPAFSTCQQLADLAVFLLA